VHLLVKTVDFDLGVNFLTRSWRRMLAT